MSKYIKVESKGIVKKAICEREEVEGWREDSYRQREEMEDIRLIVFRRGGGE